MKCLKFLFTATLFIICTLPVNIFAQIINKCGTNQAFEDYQAGIRFERPVLSGPELFIDRTLFRVHYTTQGIDAVPSLAYAESTAYALTISWAKLVDTLGWLAPPPDYGFGGDDRYDVYIMSLPGGSPGIYGCCQPESSYRNPYPDGITSHIEIINNYSTVYIPFLVCHELFHAIHARYSWLESGWWNENCTGWSTDIVFDDLNYYIADLNASPSPFTNPEYPINYSNQSYWYAGCVWAFFLTEYYGINCIRDIWENLGAVAGANTLAGIDQALSTQYSSNLVTALKNYSSWRYFTGLRADTVHFFKEGNLWPQVTILRNHTSYPASGNQGTCPVWNPGGTSYIQFSNGGGKLSISFNAQSVYDWGCNIVGYRPNNLSTVFEIALDSMGNGNDSINWGDYEHFVLIPVGLHNYNPGALPFNYSADIRIIHDVGVQRVGGISSLVDSGAVVNPQATVKNFGLYSETFPVRFTIGNYYTDTQNITLAPGDSSILSFPSCTLMVRGYNAYKCTTMLGNDERLSNNLVLNQVFVRVKDVGLIAIMAPSGNIIQGTPIQPTARIKNFGNMREIFSVQLTIGNWQITQAISLNTGLEFDIVFDSVWVPYDTGYFIVKCSTRLLNDVNPNNNQIISNCHVLAQAISEDNKSLNALCNRLEVYPNPAKTYFTVRLPQTFDRIKIFDISGNLVKEIRDCFGDCQRQPRNDNIVRVSLNGIKNGVYFVKVNDEIVKEKLVVTK